MGKDVLKSFSFGLADVDNVPKPKQTPGRVDASAEAAREAERRRLKQRRKSGKESTILSGSVRQALNARTTDTTGKSTLGGAY